MITKFNVLDPTGTVWYGASACQLVQLPSDTQIEGIGRVKEGSLSYLGSWCLYQQEIRECHQLITRVEPIASHPSGLFHKPQVGLGWVK